MNSDTSIKKELYIYTTLYGMRGGFLLNPKPTLPALKFLPDLTRRIAGWVQNPIQPGHGGYLVVGYQLPSIPNYKWIRLAFFLDY